MKLFGIIMVIVIGLLLLLGKATDRMIKFREREKKIYEDASHRSYQCKNGK